MAMDTPTNRERIAIYGLCKNCHDGFPLKERIALIERILIFPQTPSLDLGTQPPLYQHEMN